MTRHFGRALASAVVGGILAAFVCENANTAARAMTGLSAAIGGGLFAVAAAIIGVSVELTEAIRGRPRT